MKFNGEMRRRVHGVVLVVRAARVKVDLFFAADVGFDDWLSHFGPNMRKRRVGPKTTTCRIETSFMRPHEKKERRPG